MIIMLHSLWCNFYVKFIQVLITMPVHNCQPFFLHHTTWMTELLQNTLHTAKFNFIAAVVVASWIPQFYSLHLSLFESQSGIWSSCARVRRSARIRRSARVRRWQPWWSFRGKCIHLEGFSCVSFHLFILLVWNSDAFGAAEQTWTWTWTQSFQCGGL